MEGEGDEGGGDVKSIAPTRAARRRHHAARACAEQNALSYQA